MNLSQAIAQCRPGALWSLTGNDYAGLQWLDDDQAKPTIEELEAAWAQIQAIKSWPNAEAFTDSLTMEEMGAVSLSTDPIIAALRFKLSTWHSRVLVTDERVQLGLSRMVQLGIISAERKAAIEAQAS